MLKSHVHTRIIACNKGSLKGAFTKQQLRLQLTFSLTSSFAKVKYWMLSHVYTLELLKWQEKSLFSQPF